MLVFLVVIVVSISFTHDVKVTTNEGTAESVRLEENVNFSCKNSRCEALIKAEVPLLYYLTGDTSDICLKSPRDGSIFFLAGSNTEITVQ